MKKSIFSVLTFFMLFALSGCGGGSDTPITGDNGTTGTVVKTAAAEMKENYIVVNQDKITFTLPLNIIKKLDSSFLVELKNLDLDVMGCQLKSVSFTPSQLAMTGDYNTVSTLKISGEFTAPCTVGGYTFKAIQVVSKGGDVESTDFGSIFDYNNPSGGDTTPPSVKGYSFYNATTTEVSQGSTPYDVKIQLLKDGYAVPGEKIKMKAFPSVYGSVSAHEVTTGTDGFAEFDYTSPAILPANGTSTSFEVSFMDESNATITQNLVVNFNTSGGSGVNPYNLVNPSTPISVTAGNQEHEITAYVVDASTNIGVSAKDVTITTIANGYGSVDTAVATTDTAGKATFKYTAPASITGLTTTTAYMRFTENGITSEQAIVLNFTPPAGGGTQYSMINVSTPIDVANITDTKEIKVQVIDTATKVGVDGKTVRITALDAQYGTVNASSVQTTNGGWATFTYTPPTDLTGLSTTTVDLLFTDDNGNDLPAQTVTINVTPSAVQYFISPENNITVTGLAQVHTINVSLYKNVNGQNIAADDGEKVIAEFIMQSDGTLTKYEVEVQNGTARFEYTSPARNLPASNMNIKFFYKDDNTVIGQTLVIFNPQIVDRVDKMYVSPNSLTVSGSSQVQVINIVTVNAANIGISTEVQLEQLDAAYGTFDTTKVTTDIEGKAQVIYTGPTDIKPLSGDQITVKVTELSNNIIEDLNISFYTISQSTKYEIVENVPGSLSVDNVDNIGIKISEIGKPSNVIADSAVHNVTLTSEFSNMLLFENGTVTTTYSSLGDNNLIGVKTGTLSGVAIINVTADINDGVNDITITKSVPVTIISGPVTSLSLVYTGTDVDPSGLYVNNYVAHAVDKYANPARKDLRITPTIINGTKLIESDLLSVGGSSKGQLNTGDPASFQDSNGGLDYASLDIDSVSDRLIIVPNAAEQRYDQTYLGNWSINTVAGNTLGLKEAYNAATVNNLNYIIGNDKRLIFRDITTTDIVDPTGTYLTDENGTVPLKIKFDPLLAGHTVTIGAHVFDSNRTGIATIGALRWGDYTSSEVTVSNDGDSHLVTLTLGIGGPSPYHLINLHIVESSFISNSLQHCQVSVIDNFTDFAGQIDINITTSGILAPVGVDTCTVQWNKTPSSIILEY